MRNWESKENKRLNILLLKFPYFSQYGGGEWHTIILTQELKKKGAKIYLVSSCPILLSEFKKRGWPALKFWGGIEPTAKKSLLLFPFLVPFVFLNLAGLLIGYKIKYKINILYCLSLTEKILLTFLARLLKIKVFWIEHVQIEKWLIQNPLKIFYILFSKLACIICVSGSVKDQLIQLGVKERNIKVIYYGVDLEKFKIKNFKTESSKIIVGCVARLSIEKGIDDLLKAARLVLLKIPNLEFWLAGKGDQEKNLKKLAENLGIKSKVKFLGFQKGIPNLLPSFDIFALTPFRRESFGIAACEAMASGLPVVATKISGLAELVLDKKTGLIVPPRDPQAIAWAILKLAKNSKLRESFGRAGRERVEKNFTLEKMVNSYYQTFIHS